MSTEYEFLLVPLEDQFCSSNTVPHQRPVEDDGRGVVGWHALFFGGCLLDELEYLLVAFERLLVESVEVRGVEAFARG